MELLVAHVSHTGPLQQYLPMAVLKAALFYVYQLKISISRNLQVLLAQEVFP